MRRSPGWREALVAGKYRRAAFRWLVEDFGGRWSEWREPETLHQRMVEAANGFAAQWGLALRFGPEDLTVRRAVRVILWLTVHLAHYRFGRPADWRERRRDYFVGMERAQERLEMEAATQRWASGLSNMRQAVEAAARRSEARTLRSMGWSIRRIARQMDLDPRSVKRLLAEPGEEPIHDADASPGGG